MLRTSGIKSQALHKYLNLSLAPGSRARWWISLDTSQPAQGSRHPWSFSDGYLTSELLSKQLRRAHGCAMLPASSIAAWSCCNASSLGFSRTDHQRCHHCTMRSHVAAGTKLRQLGQVSETASPALPTSCLLSSFLKMPDLQLPPPPAGEQSPRAQGAEQPLTCSEEARANEQTHRGGLLATRGERKGGENCCQLVCVHLGWHFQPCNCCIMNLAMEFKSYDSFRPKKHESAPKES